MSFSTQRRARSRPAAGTAWPAASGGTRSGSWSPPSTGWPRPTSSTGSASAGAAEQTVFRVTSAGFRTVGATSRVFARSGRKGAGTRVPQRRPDRGLRPDPVRGPADAGRRRHRVRRRGRAPGRGRRQRGLPGARRPARGRPRDRAADPGRAGGARGHRRGALRRWPARWCTRRWPTATSGWPSPLSRRAPSPPRSAAGAADEQQATYLPAFTGERRRQVPAAALALTEPTAVVRPAHARDDRASAPVTATCSRA